MTKKHFAGTFHQAQDLYFGSSVTKWKKTYPAQFIALDIPSIYNPR